jgi:cyanophycin synthetase
MSSELPSTDCELIKEMQPSVIAKTGINAARSSREDAANSQGHRPRQWIGPDQSMQRLPRLERLIAMPGPSLSSELPGVRMQVTWPEQVPDPSDLTAGRARQALQAVIPGLAEGAPCPAGKPALDRLVEETAFAVMASFSPGLEQPTRPSVCNTPSPAVVLHHRDVAMADFAARIALSLTGMAVHEQFASVAMQPFSERLKQALAGYRQQWQAMAFAESSWRKIAEAERRNIPWRRLFASERVLQFGHGSRQVRSRDSLNEAESYIATHIASHKHLASELLRSSALPVPRSVVTRDPHSAQRAARDLGYPVVVKPVATDFGIAVSVNLRSDPEVAIAFELARRHGLVLIEQHVPGTNYRLLVMHGKFIAAVRQDPAHVTGDGIHRIDQLVQLANRGRSDQLSADLKKISIDAEVVRILGRQGLGLASIPSPGRRVLLREHSNLSVGGSYENVTDQVHPDNRLLAERAARAIGLKVAGIDFLTADISRSHLETGGMICEINPSPGFVMGQPGYEIEEAYFDGLFPGAADGRIPIIAVLSDRAEPELIAQIEETALSHGHHPVTATAAFVRRPDQMLAVGPFSQISSIGAALQDPAATAAIVQLTRPATAEEGLIFDRCDLAIVTESSAADDGAVDELLVRHAKRHLDAGDRQSVQAALHDALGR